MNDSKVLRIEYGKITGECMETKGQKIVKRILMILHIIVGIGALAGGLAAITNPQEPMGLSAAEALKNSLFTDFLIPGIILFTVIGIGNLFSAMCLVFKIRFKEYISGIFACALIIWIVVQCMMLKDVVFLHVLFFAIGAVQGILASILLFQQRLFPTNIILNLWDKRH